MHILVVSQYFWPENFRVNDLVKEWGARGHVVTVLTGLPNYPLGKVYDSYRSNPQAYRYYEGARVIRVPMLPRGSGGLRLILNYLSFVVGGCLWGPVRLRGVQPDVIFVFEPSPVTVGLPAVWLGQRKKVPVVFWALDLWPETLSAIGVVRSKLVLGWVAHMVRYIYKRCELVLGQSRGFMTSLAKYCDNKDKIRYFPSWSEDVFIEGNVQPAPEVPRMPGTFSVLFAGNIGEAQDMPAVLDAVERLKENLAIRWIIVGDGRKTEWLQTEVFKRGLQDRVVLAGRFPVERMPSFYAHADALLVSLKRDPVFSMTIPGKVQSYLMAGIPLLGMLDGEGAAVIRDADAGLTCDAGDGEGLANAVLALAAMPVEVRQRLGLNGRHYAQQEFGRAQLMDRLEGMLAEAVALRKANA
ncbi:glycosyltransferase family 4 protein [Curvibacter sp. HBC61]|uniref:Glycosyltransferase family 4 protein n=1 Tax=Curvibacter cyanobacteriorum TaxID=3026422 RepID=A0ABT5N1M5_9BURK|nr:glycosyltransferase family 4 protein [Curvibacter sp. HBC61]MDD0838928.1 glycosyltransferase family 4 protein [Curvibacter sp. HBC61]